MNDTRMKYSIPFLLKTSHKIIEAGFSGENSMELTFESDRMSFRLDSIDYTANIIPNESKDKFSVVIECDQKRLGDVAAFLEGLLSVYIDKNNHNRHYGCHFIETAKFGIEPIYENGGFHPSAKMMSKSITYLSLTLNGEHQETDQFMLLTYYEALKAPTNKLKFFNLVLILEYLENSDDYKEMFLNEKDFLFPKAFFDKYKCDFTETQHQRLKQLEKNNTLTTKSRKEKLYGLLKQYNVLSINYAGKTLELQESDISQMLNFRNKVFHASSVEFESVLWNKLFPLIDNIVRKFNHIV